MTHEHSNGRNTIQMVWGIALILAGCGVFYRIPQVLPKLAHIETFASAMGFIRFCFYLMAVILIGGGVQKIVRFVKAARSESLDDSADSADS